MYWAIGPVTIVLRYFALGQIRGIIPAQSLLAHSQAMESASAGSGHAIRDMQSRIAGSVTFRSSDPLLPVVLEKLDCADESVCKEITDPENLFVCVEAAQHLRIHALERIRADNDFSWARESIFDSFLVFFALVDVSERRLYSDSALSFRLGSREHEVEPFAFVQPFEMPSYFDFHVVIGIFDLNASRSVDPLRPKPVRYSVPAFWARIWANTCS
ncbi:23S rRNA (guanosine-2'-O-)-methyltransferaseRlmB [Striga asiatica]|uniref:23S rRNA (Guanosine-2'-O-)-methyltransferaseRlmB n=1 Tax=Striga asiatica TaxID=4170 RepID=A0A5A7R9T3_STRAF|nr:23S rRNA (guanosine-2'-O-)-methyltransferaseRlmB [Striga asiatica]